MHTFTRFALHLLRRLPIVATILCAACGTSAAPAPVNPTSVAVTYTVETPQAIVIRAELPKPTATVPVPTASAAPTLPVPTATTAPTLPTPTASAVPTTMATATPEIALILAKNTATKVAPIVAPTIAPTETPPVSTEAGDNDDMSTQLVKLHNQVRATLGLDDYTVSPLLQQAAQRHADWLAAKPLSELASLGDAGHTGEGGTKIAERVSRAGYRAKSSSENWHFDADGQAAFVFWSTNPGQSPNVFSATFNEIGIGVAKHSSGSFVFVAVYARKIKN